MTGHLRTGAGRLNRALRNSWWALPLVLLFSACGDHGLQPVPITGISGTVAFTGEWPSNTEWVRVLCFSEKPAPNNFIEFIAFLKGLSDPLPDGVREYHYVLELRPGTYKWIAVAWKAKDTPITSLQVIGEYHSAPVKVIQDHLVTGVDIQADFSKLQTRRYPLFENEPLGKAP